MSATPSQDPAERPTRAERADRTERRVARKGRLRERDRSTIDEVAAPIVTRRLSKRYGDLVAVDNLDLEVRAGEIFGLLGQNGAGKTTTILMLLGLAEPSAGTARVVGYDPARHPLEVKRRVGYLPDNVGFYEGMSGRANLRYTARLNGLTGSTAEIEIDRALDQVGMSGRANDSVETYSRGMLQRLGIADALVKDPAVLILDEPTTAIDPIGVIEILDLLRGLVEERGLAVLLSSHLLAQVQSVCDRVGIFAAGKLIGVGTVPELARQFGDAGVHIEVGFEGLDDAGRRRVRDLLGSVAGVSEARLPASARDPFVVLVGSEDSGPAREAVLATAAREGLRLSSIREVMPSLDDIYRRALSATGLAQKAEAAA